jgi:hypothetical protein
LRLDQLELGQNVGIAQIVVCMQQRKDSESLVHLIMRT